jgi:hypothetical protein
MLNTNKTSFSKNLKSLTTVERDATMMSLGITLKTLSYFPELAKGLLTERKFRYFEEKLQKEKNRSEDNPPERNLNVQ